MALDHEQIQKLLSLVGSHKDDQLDCDRCFVRIAEFADDKILHQHVSDAMDAVATHLDSCPCCADEFATLLVALYEIELEQDGAPV